MKKVHGSILAARDPLTNDDVCPSRFQNHLGVVNKARCEDGKKPLTLAEFVKEWRLTQMGLRYQANLTGKRMRI